MRIGGLRQAELAIDCHGEPTRRVCGEELSGPGIELFGRRNVVGKMRAREKNRTGLGEVERGNSIDKAGYLPPKFTSADFRKASYWRQRGKLDVPNERFISYPGRGAGPYFGWAGWNHAQRAEALGYLIEEGSDGSTDSVPTPIPLLAGLQELLPWLVQWHKADAPHWTSLRDHELDRHGLTEEEVVRWQPPAPRRGRPPKAKP